MIPGLSVIGPCAAAVLAKPRAAIVFLVAATFGAGCAPSARELDIFAAAVQRVPIGADNDIPRLVLGFPTHVGASGRTWWYLKPPAGDLGGAHGGVSALFRFDARKKVIEREMISWVLAGRAAYRLQSERIVAGETPSTEDDFAAILGGKLADLARTNQNCHFDRQEASYQLLANGVLLLSMERWMRPGTGGPNARPTTLTQVRGEVDVQAHPQVAEALRLAWQIRRFAIELDFEPASR